MTKEQKEEFLQYLRNLKLIQADDFYREGFDMAISALSEELSEDGTLTVHVSDGSKVKRVFVMGDNIFGGLYYPDSAENKGDLIRQAEDYENEIADLHNRLDIAEYDKERLREEITILEAENKGEDRPQGHWIEKGYVGDGNYLFECSECHSTDTQSKTAKVNYCWHCGADMREPKTIGVFKRLNDSVTGEPIQDIRELMKEKETE